MRSTGHNPKPDVRAVLTFCMGRVILSELFKKPKTILMKGHLPELLSFWLLPLLITHIRRWRQMRGKEEDAAKETGLLE